MQIHILSCTTYRDAFLLDPDTTRDPVAEFERHRSEGTHAVDKALKRDRRLQARFAELDDQQQRAQRRWSTPTDLLAD